MRLVGRFIIFGIFIWGISSVAQVRSFQSCSRAEPGRTELDNLCPRLEGVHLEGCCPPLRSNTTLQCRYHIVRERGQQYLAQSSYTVCQNNMNVNIPCCAVMRRTCVDAPVTLNYIPRLIHRAKTCCFENCPPADYWRQAPANPQITPDHEYAEGVSPAGCTGTILQECSIGNSVTCQANDPCPTPAPAPAPNPGTPKPGTPTPGTPMPAPGPAPAPVPAPAPAPAPPSPPPPVDPDGS